MSPVSTDLYGIATLSGLMQECLRNCLDCVAACRVCAEGCIGDPAMEACLRACLDCQATCDASVSLMAFSSPLHAQMCGVCADACERCADECARHDADHCQACAEACRRCAETCRQMAQA